VSIFAIAILLLVHVPNGKETLNAKAAFSHVANMPPTLLITGNGFTVTTLVTLVAQSDPLVTV
jgi:uncharacterized alpha/beta hydrolase family protein